MATIDETREQIRRLSSLMDDPHPGLFSWNMIWGKALNDFCEYDQEKDATIASQAATIERFRALVRELDNVFGPDSWLWNDCGDSRAAITVADMGQTE